MHGNDVTAGLQRCVPGRPRSDCSVLDLIRRLALVDQRGGGLERTSPSGAAASPPKEEAGLDGADEAFHSLCRGTSRLVQLLADELVPLDDSTVRELAEVIETMRNAVPHLATWRNLDPSATDWILEPPLKAVGVSLNQPTDLLDHENVERLRRSLDFLVPGSLALRKEAAVVVVDAIIDLLRQIERPPQRTGMITPGFSGVSAGPNPRL